MSVLTCTTCGTCFSARSDAVYCSPACRQKAHRARTARRAAEQWELPTAGYRAARSTAEDDRRWLHRSGAISRQRAHEEVDRSRELCLVSANRLQRTAAIRQEFADNRAANAPRTASPNRAPWLGD